MELTALPELRRYIQRRVGIWIEEAQGMSFLSWKPSKGKVCSLRVGLALSPEESLLHNSKSVDHSE